MEKIRLLVPYEDKDIAKALGAIWDYKEKYWFITNEENYPIELFNKWLPVYQNPTLFIDLIPQNSWFTNLRSELTEEEWKNIKSYIYKRANYCCEICGGKGDNHPVEAHERWEYNQDNLTQKLIGIQALCPSCHLVTHFGSANVQGRHEEAKIHLLTINNWTEEEFEEHYDLSFSIWEYRSEFKWKIDTTWIIKNFLNKLSLNSIENIMNLYKK